MGRLLELARKAGKPNLQMTYQPPAAERLSGSIAEAAAGQCWPANVANPAKTRAVASDPALRTGCEFLRSEDAVRNDSQGLRKPESRAVAAFSQDSQASQAAAAEPAERGADGPAAESPSPRAESRRRRALALIAERPERKRALVADPDDPAHPGDVVLTVALRTDDGPVTAELVVQRERYDAFKLLQLLQRHDVTH